MAATMPLRTYRVELHQDPGSTAWWVSVPALPGCFTQGETQAEALKRAQEAVLGHLAALALRFTHIWLGAVWDGIGLQRSGREEGLDNGVGIQ
jgi:predicted RNase H-like HicB family nuclease